MYELSVSIWHHRCRRLLPWTLVPSIFQGNPKRSPSSETSRYLKTLDNLLPLQIDRLTSRTSHHAITTSKNTGLAIHCSTLLQSKYIQQRLRSSSFISRLKAANSCLRSRRHVRKCIGGSHLPEALNNGNALFQFLITKLLIGH